MITTTAINFFREQRRVNESQEELDGKIFKGGVTVIICALLVMGGTTAWWLWRAQQLTALQDNQSQQERLISQSKEDEAQYVSFATRLDTMYQLLQTRNSKKEALDFLALLAQSDLSFDGISYDSKSKQLSFRVQADSVFGVEEFLEKLRQPNISVYYTAIDVSNIRRDEAGAYIMEVRVTLSEGSPSAS